MTAPSADDVGRRAAFAALLASAGLGLGAAALPEPSVVVPGRVGAVLLQGDGIDSTGARDSAPAVQALLDAAPAGSTIVNPSGAVLRLDRGLTVRRPGTVLTGSGEWRFRAGGDYGVDPDGQNGFIDVRADRCRLDGLRVTNPDRVLNRGLVLLADHGSVTGCTLTGFGQGITVSPAGEYHAIVISGNQVIDVLGDGGGPADTSTAGESYGDGIVCWGAAVTITGNVVSCRDGADARIGIHVEGLDSQARTPWVHGHRLAAISGNVVMGRFRRGIVSEGVHHVAITGNAIADSTWWSIALISADHAVVAHNTIRWTRTPADIQGSAWGPVRSAIALYGVATGQPVRDPLVVDNAIDVPTGAEAVAAVSVLGNDDGAPAVLGGRIAGNRVSAEGALAYGVLARQPSEDLEVEGNRLAGYSTAGIALSRPDGAQVRGNTLQGAASAERGVDVAGGTRLRCEGNRVVGGVTGIRVTGSGWTVVRDSVLEGQRVGVDVTGATGRVVVDGTVAIAVAEVQRGG